MTINSMDKTSFGMKIKINKSVLRSDMLNSSANEASKVYGSASLITGMGSGADMFVHSAGNNMPAAVANSFVFDGLREFGHSALNIINKEHVHNGYDASFFSTVLSATGANFYKAGAQKLAKCEKNSKNIPT